MEHVLARLTSTQSREPLISQGLSYCKCCLMSESQRRTSTPRASAHLPWSLDTPARLLQLVVSHSGFATLGTGLPPLVGRRGTVGALLLTIPCHAFIVLIGIYRTSFASWVLCLVQAACVRASCRRWWLGLDQVFKMTDMLASPASAFRRHRAR